LRRFGFRALFEISTNEKWRQDFSVDNFGEICLRGEGQPRRSHEGAFSIRVCGYLCEVDPVLCFKTFAPYAVQLGVMAEWVA